MDILVWAGILVCLSQSAMLSGLNLGLFSMSKLELEVEARKGNRQARRVLDLRKNANFALVTILWGNVAVNVLLALLSGSVLTGVGAFLFSTVIITIFAEIIPQSYFTRHALKMASMLAPVLRVYQVILFPVAAPTARILDAWLGGESVRYFPESDLRRVIKLHMDSAESDIARVEGQGALNFLDIDDVPLADEGEPVDPDSILELPFEGTSPRFPAIEADPGNTFLQQIARSGRSWVILADTEQEPRLVMNANEYLRAVLFEPELPNPLHFCHRPIIKRNAKVKLGELIPRFRVRRDASAEEVVEDDVILLWHDQPRVITGTDVLGRLLRGIASPHTGDATPTSTEANG